MDTAATTAIAVFAALIGVVISYRNTDNKIENTGQQLGKDHTGLSQEHSSLSKEHTGITDHLKDVLATATYLKEDVIRRNGQLEILSTQEHDHAAVAQTSLDILIQDLHNVRNENAELRQTIQLLQQRNSRMAEQLYGQFAEEQSEEYQLEP